MQVNELFLTAMKKGLYKKRAWIISGFSIILESVDEWTKDPYDYRIVQTPTGHFYVDPSSKELFRIEGTTPNEPIFKFSNPIDLKADDCPNLSKDIRSTIGDLFVNYVCLVYPFNKKIPYNVGFFDIKKIEATIAKVLTDTPAQQSDKKDNLIYVDEYVKFADSISYLEEFAQLCVWAGTFKTMTGPENVKQVRDKLLLENKDHLDDPLVISRIEKELIALDTEYLKGDPGENFLNSSKARNVVRKKQFLMIGAEAGLEGGNKVDAITNSLDEGWDIKKFPSMNNNLRAGSFNRGAETALGGEAVKWLLRASSNVRVVDTDCGTTIGKVIDLEESNKNLLLDFSVVTKEGYKTITDENELGAYLGKKIMIRSPMYCKLTKTDYCKVCVGVKLAKNPTALSLVVSDYGSKMMYIFMQAVHGKALTTARLDWKKHFK
jgi:hypothetical protein